MSEATVEESTQQFSEKVEQVLEMLSGFTLLELSELVEAFEEKFGIQAAVPMAVAAGVPAAGADAEEEEEPTSFKVVLKDFGDKKIQVIKAVRSQTTLALKEAKELVEGVPATVKDGLSKEEADKCAAVLAESGAGVEVQPE